MKTTHILKFLFLFCAVQFYFTSLIHAQSSVQSTPIQNGSASFSSSDEKLQTMKSHYLQLSEKYNFLVKEPTTDKAVLIELQQKIEILEIQIAERTEKQNIFLAEEKRQIERETGYVYNGDITIADELAAFQHGNESKELNKLKYDLLILQADVEKNFRILSEDEKARKKFEIQNLRKQINKLEAKIQNK